MPVPAVAFLFPGQGSQSLGMLDALSNTFSIVRDTVEEANDILSLDLKAIISNDEDALNQTENTQPALLTATIGIWRVLQEAGLSARVMAGHSVGEYAALVASGVLKYSDALLLVQRRGLLMRAASPGSMAAVLGIPASEVQKICGYYSGDGIVEVANLNAPTQTVIAGHTVAIEGVTPLLKEAGAKRVVTLNVTIASHCSLQKESAKELEGYLQQVRLTDPQVPLLHNVDASVALSIDEVRTKVIEQLYRPVLWTNTIEAVADMGIRHVIECGPGRVLCGLTRQINPNLKCLGSHTPEAIEITINTLN